MNQPSSKKKVLITGGLGFIGSHLINQLVLRNDVYKIVVVDCRAHRFGNLSQYVLARNPKIDLHIKNIVDQDVMAELALGCDVIYHLAAETHVQRSIALPDVFIDSNVLGTFSVLQAARRHGCRLIYASTSEVYGSVPNGGIDESSPLEGYSPYAASKIAADRLVLSYVNTYGLDATIVRMFNAYGPGQHFEKVIPMFICSALCGLPLPIQGDGSAVRDWNYVEDVAARLAHLLQSRLPFAVCNLASGEQMAIHELAERITRLAGGTHLFLVHYEERAGHVRHQRANASKTTQLFGPVSIDLNNGLTRTFTWYRERVDDWRPIFLGARPSLISEIQRTGTIVRDKALPS
ncbi:MAG: GDP-mannose 4,6-dehydratase [Betaproteobacteria bacterium]|nr:GDP-mannose 4,6-dehydratase [Betaproteobacteria bacterium]